MPGLAHANARNKETRPKQARDRGNRCLGTRVESVVIRRLRRLITMRSNRRWTAPVGLLAVVVALLGTAGCASSHKTPTRAAASSRPAASPSPPSASARAALPSSTQSRSVALLPCQTSAPDSESPRSSSPSAERSAGGVVAWWQMSPRDRHCPVTRGDSALAATILAAVASAPTVDPTASTACGADLGIAVALVVDQGDRSFPIKVGLGGCWTLETSDAPIRHASDQLLQALLRLAPPAFQPIVQGGMTK